MDRALVVFHRDPVADRLPVLFQIRERPQPKPLFLERAHQALGLGISLGIV